MLVMKFHWWWILVAIPALWLAGWFVTVVGAVFFNPLDSGDENREDLRDRLLGHAVLQFFIWPVFLPEFLARQRLYRDVRTGKKPAWIVRSKGDGRGSCRTARSLERLFQEAVRHRNQRTSLATTRMNRSPERFNSVFV